MIKAQARRLEIENSRSEGEKAALDYQDAILSVFATHFFLRLRPIADWTHAALFSETDGDLARRVAGDVQGWLIGARSEIEQELKDAIQRSRNRGYVISDYGDLMRLLGREPDMVLHEED